ncbi:hypothetical protein AOLI_G00144530 [Acnodon oligacanthus]
MDRIPSANLLPTLLTFLLLQGVLNVQTRSLVGSGNQVFQSKDDANIQNRIIALLLHKNIIPDQEDMIGLELGSRIAELQEQLHHSNKTFCGVTRESESMLFILLLFQLASLLPLGHFCPSGCVCVSDGGVKCTGAITDIPPVDANHTYLLRLNDTSIKILKAQSIQHLTLLLRFSITHSSLDTIHAEAFYGASQLRSIMLSYNALSVLPAGVFSRLGNLEQLRLEGNQLASLSADIFQGLVNLTELNLSKNQIAKLDANVFQGMTSLNDLNLSGNLLWKLPQTLFHNLVQLKSLILYSNQLETLEQGSFDHLPKLLVLMLNKNKIQEIPPQLFWRIPSLLTLTLSNNQLQYLPAESFYFLPSITKLTLYNNPLISLPEQLMGHMPRLQELYLYNTNLSTVPWNLFANMTGLRSLNFHYNEKLSSLPRDLFCCQPNLQKLSLKYNNLQHLHPDQFSQLVSLKILLLNDNALQSLSSRIFRNLPNLAKLELSHNHLSYLPGDVFEGANSLQSVTLGHNRLDCVCSIMDFVEWINKNQRVVTDLNDVLCDEPYHLQNHKLVSLTYDHLRCGITTTLTRHEFVTTASVIHSETTVPLRLQHPPYPSTTRSSQARQDTSISTVFPSTPSSDSSFSPHSSAETSPSTPLTEEPFYVAIDAFYDTVVFDSCPNIVHSNRYKGWVYLWTVPATGLYGGLLLALHIVLIATGVILIVASAYALYRLNKVVWELGTAVTRNQTIIAKRLPSFKGKR